MSLAQLAPELIDAIAAHLDVRWIDPYEEDPDYEYYTGEGEMPRYTDSTSYYHVSEDVVNLSSTCKRLRAVLARRVFGTVTVSHRPWRPERADSALLAVQRYGEHVRTLRFLGYLDSHSEDLTSGHGSLWSLTSSDKRWRGSQVGVDSDDDDSDRDGEDSEDEAKDDQPPVRDDQEEHEDAQDQEAYKPQPKLLRGSKSCDMRHVEKVLDTEERAREWGFIISQDPKVMLRDSARYLLKAGRGPHLMPNLERVVIRFDLSWFDTGSEMGTNYTQYGNGDQNHAFRFFTKFENDEDVKIQETRKAMRLFCAELYKALASSETPAPGLVLEQWPPRGVSTFLTDEWRAYLGKLEHFEVNLLHSESDEHPVARCNDEWPLTTLHSEAAYGQGVKNMGRWFFQHLANLKTLKFGFAVHGGLEREGGGREPDGWNCYIGFPWRGLGETEWMPALERVELVKVFVGQEIVDFVAGHKLLRTLILRDAKSPQCLDSTDEALMSWEAFFNEMLAVNQSSDSGISQFICTTTDWVTKELEKDMEMEEAEGLGGFGDVGKEVVRVAFANAEDEHGQNIASKVWGYGYINETGVFKHHCRRTIESFIEGKDQAAYEKFVESLASKRAGKRT